ncbi:MAG: DUF465 domain-containing protein [Deltaproteobacteria bacterium]|nr:DUF465 domain-containing protein [Deltaproteobacteria bacterium]
MDPRDLDVIQRYVGEDETLEVLYKEHISYEKQLAKLASKLFLSPQEELKKKELQKKKLIGKDRLEAILKKYRNNH